ncbi:MAG: flagellar filament capping protein FliD [Spirochaetota bacterium]|nr:flagellar filament capping protein FliD [Spirochaetota bacterium]
MHFILFLIIFIMIPNISIAQRVQISGIPGQDSDMNITDMLDQIMAPYYSELTNLNNNKIDKEIEFELWQDFKQQIKEFEQVNNYIMGYESAFRSLTNTISDPTAIQAQVARTAKYGEYRAIINTLASPHSFASAPISIDKTIVKGDFSIIINTNTNSIQFSGGDITSLFNLLRSTLSNNIDVKLLNASDTKKIIALVGKKEGAINKIQFDGDLAPLLDTRILTTGEQSETNIQWSLFNTNLIISNSSITIETSYPLKDKTLLSFSALLTDIILLVEDENTNKISLSNLTQNTIGEITNLNIILPGATPILEDIALDIDNPIIVKEPIQQLVLIFDDNTIENIPLKNEKYSISLDKFIDKTLVSITAMAEKKILNISDLTLISSPDGALKPYNETSKAQDSVLLLDGLEITRPSNIVSDLIPGVTLELLQEKTGTIRIQIKPDIELIKDTIIQWVVKYNNIMEEIFIYTTIPLNQIGRTKPLHIRKKNEEDLKEGTFYGNTSLIGFKDRMRRLAGSPHGLDQNSLSLLDQIGIYTRRRTSLNNDPDALRKGTLTLDVRELEKILNEKFEEVNKLFVLDTDGNNIADRGVAISATSTLKMMIGGNGFLDKIEQDNSKKMKDLNAQITKKEEAIEVTDRKERQALLQMNQAIVKSKALSESLQQRLK